MKNDLYGNLTGENLETEEILDTEVEDTLETMEDYEDYEESEEDMKVRKQLEDMDSVEQLDQIESPIEISTEHVDSPRETKRMPRAVVYEEEEDDVEEIEEAVYVAPVRRADPKQIKSTLNDNLVFNGDEFLTGELSPNLYSSNSDTLSIPLEEKDLYKTKVNIEHIESVIKRAFKANARRVSFSLEELGLHNRLIEMGIPQDLEEFILVKTEKGNVVVHKTTTSRTDIESILMTEASKCLSNGQRIVLPLLETYKFRDKLGIVSERYRYRASLAEIKSFVARTGMKATITKDSFLVIYE